MSFIGTIYGIERQAVVNAVMNMWTLYKANNYSINCVNVKMSRGDLLLELIYRGAGKSLARPTSRCVLFDSKNISFDASLVIYINSTNIPPIMIINRIYEH